MTGTCPRHGDFNSLKGHCELCEKELFLGRQIGSSEASTLRDQFAMAALSGMLAYSHDDVRGTYHNNSDPENNAKLAYRYADAMLEARKVKS